MSLATRNSTQDILRTWVAVHMYFPPDVAESLRQLSFFRRETRADLIREAVAAYLKKQGMKVA